MSEHYDQNGNLVEDYHMCGCRPVPAPLDVERRLNFIFREADQAGNLAGNLLLDYPELQRAMHDLIRSVGLIRNETALLKRDISNQPSTEPAQGGTE